MRASSGTTSLSHCQGNEGMRRGQQKKKKRLKPSGPVSPPSFNSRSQSQNPVYRDAQFNSFIHNAHPLTTSAPLYPQVLSLSPHNAGFLLELIDGVVVALGPKGLDCDDDAVPRSLVHFAVLSLADSFVEGERARRNFPRAYFVVSTPKRADSIAHATRDVLRAVEHEIVVLYERKTIRQRR